MTYKPPRWFTGIQPLKSHGHGVYQQRLWRVVANHVKQRDFTLRAGRCVSCHRRVSDWTEYQAGHYKAWSVCNGFFKFEPKNIAGQCAFCNLNSDGPTGTEFGEELIRTYGPDHLAWIEKENNRHMGEKLENHKCVELAGELLCVDN